MTQSQRSPVDIAAEGKAVLHGYLRVRRADLRAKLDGLGEYDLRRPLTPTGTNLLGLVKHVATVQLGYFGEVFGRPGRILPWEGDEAGANDDLWAGADETVTSILELHDYSAAHSDATIEALAPDAPGSVPWWSEERRAVTLQQILVHMCVETARHAGHADIVRELIDGSVGNGSAGPNVPPLGDGGWRAHHDEVEAAARAAANRYGSEASRTS